MSSSKKILVVDDEKPLREFVARNLAARGFEVLRAASGLEALALFNSHQPDLIVLDVMMPHIDGLETCRRIRQTSTVPIIVLTALGEEVDKVNALDAGADDYLTKPFGVDELLARVRAVFRRIDWASGPVAERAILSYRDLALDTQQKRAVCRGETLKLTRTEFTLLHFLMRHLGKALPHRLILQNVWGPGYGDEPEYLRVYIGRLRRKIEPDPARPEYILTEYGIGYRFGV